MGLGEVVGGVALVGLAVLFGLALTEDEEPNLLTTEDTVGFAPAGSGVTSTTTSTGTSAATDATLAPTPQPTATSAAAEATEATEATTAATEVVETTTTEPAQSSTTSAATSTTEATVPLDQRPAVRVRVLNAGVETGAAAYVSGVLKQTGFEPLEPRDAPAAVDAVTVLYAPGKRAQGLTVNAVIEADPANVIEATDGDANWAALGSDVDVLVLLGPDG